MLATMLRLLPGCVRALCWPPSIPAHVAPALCRQRAFRLRDRAASWDTSWFNAHVAAIALRNVHPGDARVVLHAQLVDCVFRAWFCA